MTHPIIFIYSNKDENDQQKLSSHLDVLVNTGLITLWSIEKIGPGAIVKDEYRKAISGAKIAILLITPSFFGSKQIQEITDTIIFESDNRDDLMIFPVIARACAYRQIDWLKGLAVRPADGEPIFGNRNEDFNKPLAVIAQEIASILQKEEVPQSKIVHVANSINLKKTKEQFQQDEPEPSKPLDDEEINARRKRLQDKLDHLRNSSCDSSGNISRFFRSFIPWLRRNECPFAVVGSVYLDIKLSSLDEIKFDRKEYINFRPIEVSWGGSSLYVSRYLWELFGHKCHVFSMIGKKNDPLTQTFERLIENNDWFHNRFEPGLKNIPNGVTVQLSQPDTARGTHTINQPKKTTFLTHVGVLSSFDWGMIKDDLKTLLENGGVLYISGYLKTNLQNGLSSTLEDLQQRNSLICVDHGRLGPSNSDRSRKVVELKAAFRRGLVDIYFCTLEEIRDFYEPEDELDFDNLTDTDIQTFLNSIAEKHPLPLITIIRDIRRIGSTKAYAIIENSPYTPLNGRLAAEILKTDVADTLSPRNHFNAAMIHNLIFCGKNSDIYGPLAELVKTAAQVPKKLENN